MFKDLLLIKQEESQSDGSSIGEVKLLDPSSAIKAAIIPEKSDLGIYKAAFNKD